MGITKGSPSSRDHGTDGRPANGPVSALVTAGMHRLRRITKPTEEHKRPVNELGIELPGQIQFNGNVAQTLRLRELNPEDLPGFAPNKR